MSVRHRILLTGGGTGGHIYPALAVAEVLSANPDVESLLYIGASGHLEEKLAKERNLQFVGLKVSGLPRRFSPKLFTWPGEFASAVMQARKTLKLFRATAVLGTGGYASAAPLAAAASMSIPYAIHEPDAHAGLVNRVFAPSARLVSLGMEQAAPVLKPRSGRQSVNGNPVRQTFSKPLSRDAACAVLGLNKDLKTIVITGGSQGAQALNMALANALPQLLAHDPPLQIIHQSGQKNLQEFRERLDPAVLHNSRYILRPYFEDLALPYAVADLAVCRAGAMTIAELEVSGVPAVFVPYPYAAADHQTHNAQFLSKRGAAVVLPQSQLTGASLQATVIGLLDSAQRLKSMQAAMRGLGRPNAAADLAAQLMSLSKES